MHRIKPNVLKQAILTHGNAITVAKELGITKHQVYHFAKTRKLPLSAGRPKKYNYDQKSLLKRIKKSLTKRGALAKLSTQLGVPYYVITNLAKKLKPEKSHDPRIQIPQKRNDRTTI